MDGSRKQLRKKLVLFTLIFCAVQAVEARADKVNAEWYSTLHALSMGNAAITIADDPSTAMFYNPALLANQKHASLEIFNPQLEMGLGNIGISKTISDYTRQLQLKNAYPLLKDHPNKASSFGAAIYPNFSAQNFAIGVLGKAESSAYVDGNGKLTFRSRYLVIPTMGLSVGLFSGRIRFGVAGRAINITANDHTVSSATGYGYLVNAQEGFGIGLDAGTTITLPWSTLPTIGLVARNIGDTSFPSNPVIKIATGTTVRPDLIRHTYDAGFSIAPKLSQRSVLTIASDLRDITNTAETNYLRHINLGFDITSRKILSFRFGVSRGYWTAGFGFNARKGSLEIGSYAEELDASGFRKVEDRRLAIRYGGRF